MTSKLKKLKDLERKLTVSVPVEEYNSKFQKKLNNIKGKAELDGFRKGKVPNDLAEPEGEEEFAEPEVDVGDMAGDQALSAVKDEPPQ